MTSYVFNFIVLHHDHFLRRLLGDSAGSQCCSIDSPKRNSALGPTSPSRSKSSSFCWQPIGRRKIPAEWTATCSVRPPQLSIGHPDAESRYKALTLHLSQKATEEEQEVRRFRFVFFFGCGFRVWNITDQELCADTAGLQTTTSLSASMPKATGTHPPS